MITTENNGGELEKLNSWEEAIASPYEHMWVLLGRQYGDLWHARMYPMAKGGPVSVSFDANKVVKQEEKHANVIGFLHSHPGMTNHYSDRDDRTMKAWVTCFGKPLACCIIGVNGLTAWWYNDDENRPESYQVRRLGKLIFGVTPELYTGACAGNELEEK